MFANVLYLITLAVASPWIAYRALRHGRYRRGTRQKLWGLSASEATDLTQGRPCVWVHAVSVGEVNLMAGVVKRLEQQCPDVCIVVSTSTDTGYDLAISRFGEHRVFFCPLDFSWAVQRTLRNLSPLQLVIAELELWPNLIRIATDRGCPVSIINARLSDRSSKRYQQFRRWMGTTFGRLHWVGCQDDATRQHFQACGAAPDRLSVTGSLKFDNAPSSRDVASVQRLVQWAGVDPWHRVWIMGSTQSAEEAMAIEIYQSLRVEHPELRLILVPRHKERFDSVARLVQQSGLQVHRRSTDSSMYDDDWNNDQVILVDTIGELRDWWGVGQIATVGGSFGDRGGQNMLEPAGYGAAVSFGPNTRNFRQIANQLIEAQAAVRVANQSELAAFVLRCLEEIPAADGLGRSAQAVVARHRGATKRTVDQLCQNIESALAPPKPLSPSKAA
ncbi:3-deoxy-D-manno-octulosonic acid transferase [Rubripirellula lacrimiformis]|uniref:3-deoxy-D-manno-octulosonic acid transferase n=1 Tax=Rubripirellula lacrimiformis TaxID=1930273 RepID=A0A517NIM2_9BACT|nr:3-deoxy-D-manno-octulosonic acid transferase [Rubripirellula lacrimiformis]QDT06987.1 3-deoxy-D-manno-octulosonic acid transferase [Rubripirellula lacrimiformis]